MTQEQANADIRAKKQLAAELEAFMQTSAWQFMTERMIKDRDAATSDFAEADPSNIARIIELQKRIGVINLFEKYINEIVAAGQMAEQAQEISAYD